MPNKLPLLALEEWRDTRDALHHAVRLMGAIRRANTPAHPRGWHGTLQVGPTGLRTGPVPSGTDAGPFEIDFDLGACTFGVEGGEELEYLDVDEDVYTLENMGVWAVAQIELCGAKTAPDLSGLDGDAELEIDEDEAEDYMDALAFVHGVFEEFANGLTGGWTSPVHFCPDRFALCVQWFSGNLVQGSGTDEALTVRFSTGDDAVDEPHFAVTAETAASGFDGLKLPHGATWNAPAHLWAWAKMRALKDPRGALLKVLRAAQAGSAALMA